MNNDAHKANLATRGFTSGSIQDRQKAYFRAAAITFNDIAQAEMAYLASKGFTQPSLSDRQYAYCKSLGYTGALDDLLSAAYRANTYYT